MDSQKLGWLRINRNRRLSEYSPPKPEEGYQDRTLFQYIDDFVEYCIAKGLSKSTIATYTMNLRQFYEFTGEVPIKEINHEFIREFLKILETVSKRIVTISSLRHFGRFLGDEMGLNPFQHLQTPKHIQQIPDALTETEMNYLFDMLETPEEKVIIEILYSTGIRKSELIHLKLEDIDFDDELVKINDDRKHKEGIVPIGKKALEAIEKYGLPTVTPEKLRIIFKKYSEKLGKRIHPQLLRQTCATHMLQRGADIKFVQQMLRHESISTTQIYAHLSFVELKEVRDILDGHLPSFTKFEPKVKTPKEVKEEKEFAQSCSDTEKLNEVNPLLNIDKIGKILGISGQAVIDCIKKSDLRGEYIEGLGYYARKNYIDFVNKWQPKWLIVHRKYKKRDIRETIKKTIEILRESGKKLAPDDNRTIKIHANKPIYMSNKELAEHLGVGPSYIGKTLKPALYKHLKMRKWAEEKLRKAFEEEIKQFKLQDDTLLTSDIVDTLI